MLVFLLKSKYYFSFQHKDINRKYIVTLQARYYAYYTNVSEDFLKTNCQTKTYFSAYSVYSLSSFICRLTVGRRLLWLSITTFLLLLKIDVEDPPFLSLFCRPFTRYVAYSLFLFLFLFHLVCVNGIRFSRLSFLIMRRRKLNCLYLEKGTMKTFIYA